jgi:hypothetical protein
MNNKFKILLAIMMMINERENFILYSIMIIIHPF